MGKTPKPLAILVRPDIAEWPEIEALRAQGHRVHVMGLGGDERDYDLILAPNAWRMTKDLRPYLDLAIKAARKQRYGKGTDDG